MVDVRKLGNGATAPANDYPVVVPDNIGEGIIWDDAVKKYKINLGDGLEIKNGKVKVKQISRVETAKFDAGSALVSGRTYTIDYGNGLIEVNGLISLPLATTPNNRQASDPDTVGQQVDGTVKYGMFNVPTTYNGRELYHKESVITISAASLGMSNIVGVNAVAGDVSGYLTEAVWLRNRELGGDSVDLGVHLLAFKEAEAISVMFQIKGIKA